MKLGIDSYSYHRYFGEVYAGVQKEPSKKMDLEDFLKRAKELGVDGVSLETCFMKSFKSDYLKKVRELLDEYNFEVVVAWGHPLGLEGGRNKEAAADMVKHFETCKILGANVMRMVGSSLDFRNDPHLPQIKNILGLLREPVKIAEDSGIKLAMENHFDFTIEEMLLIIESINSKNFGITFDSGNCLRNGDEPVQSARLLGEHIFATHLKDVAPMYGADPKEWYYYACTPIGQGVIDIPSMIKVLAENNYKGLLAVEIDFLDPKYEDEDKSMVSSIDFLRKILNKK
jgi:sugar phosphate isomerase/epimerase